ncbi:hypothetical protein BXO88_15180 [Oribacterium sp. C9]|uniref:MATE family efflux transporter n=1 Tax=Oribacterium sp. C9 TaxID=1943579 RepID=UPI00098FE4DD|nr:MATE family efflux transporter [Oribacterium sp. C9]OON84868.1 hypothetical protein BXO88_15180 [Oribacterium sp. C9]
MKEIRKTDIISNVFKSMFAVQIMTMFTGIVGSVVDGMVTGRFLGENAMASFGFTNSVSLAVAIVGGIMSTGTSVVCGKSIGKGELEDTRHSFYACFSAALAVSAILAFIIIAFAPLAARLMGAQGELVLLAADYIRGYGIACPGIIFVAFLMPVMQMDGEMNRLMMAVVIMTVGDIIADLLNVLVFHGGMFGMALATAVSYYLALLCLLPHFAKKDVIFDRPLLVFDGRIVGEMCQNGMPTAITQLGRLLITFTLNRYLMGLGGGSVVAAQAVIMTVGNLCLVPGTALASGVQVVSGVLNGEEDRVGIIRLMRTAMCYNATVNGACMLLFLIFARPVVSMFYNGGTSAVDMVVTGFRFFALCMIFHAINLVFRSYCQGSEQTKTAYVITICDCFVGPLVMALVLGGLFGVPTVWLCYVFGEGLTSVVMLSLFRIKNKERHGFEAFIPFSESFGADITADFEYHLSKKDIAEAVSVSQKIGAFCVENGAQKRTSFLMGLAAEEAVGNVIEHGFSDGKPHSVEVRVLKKDGGWMLRVRDDCRLFDPGKYIEQYTGDDPSANIGLKLLREIALEITYVNALKLNNLMIKV